jgi:hypothetical protein
LKLLKGCLILILRRGHYGCILASGQKNSEIVSEINELDQILNVDFTFSQFWTMVFSCLPRGVCSINQGEIQSRDGPRRAK